MPVNDIVGVSEVPNGILKTPTNKIDPEAFLNKLPPTLIVVVPLTVRLKLFNANDPEDVNVKFPDNVVLPKAVFVPVPEINKLQ